MHRVQEQSTGGPSLLTSSLKVHGQPLKATVSRKAQQHRKFVPVQNNASLNQIQASRGVLHHKQSNIFFEVNKDRIRPLPTPGSSLKILGTVIAEDGLERNILEIAGSGPYYFSISGRQLGPEDAGSMVSFVVPFDELSGQGKTHHLNVIM